jgi:hypothetical protein
MDHQFVDDFGADWGGGGRVLDGQLEVNDRFDVGIELDIGGAAGGAFASEREAMGAGLFDVASEGVRP